MIVLFAAVALGACTSRYGTYITVVGGDGLAFDRLEFYFGAHLDGEAVPTSPRLTVPANAGYLAKRLYAETDVQTLAARDHAFTYYLPQSDASRKLGDVVVVVAYVGAQPIGIGQLRAFTIPDTDIVYTYTVALAPFDAKRADVWGRRAGASCVRYEDPEHGDTVAIVRHDDLDCDAFPDAGVDCAPLRYCDGTSGHTGCTGTIGCLEDQPACALGACRNSDQTPRECAPTTCLPEAVCTACIKDAPIDDELHCATDDPSHGDDELIPIIPNTGALCTNPYTFMVDLPGNLLCEEPQVVSAFAFPAGTPNDFTVTIATGSSLEACAVTLTDNTPVSTFPQAYHMMISVKGATQLRSTFVLGLQPTPAPCGPITLTPVTPVGECP